MSPSTIEWTDETWNATTGCDRVSPGCDHCYIERTPPFRIEGRRFDAQGRMGVRLHPERLGKPLHWRKPRRVFVNSLSDLFHKDIPTQFIVDVFAVMALSRRHTYQVLTKRPQRMMRVLAGDDFADQVARTATEILASTGPSGPRLEVENWRPTGDAEHRVWHPPTWPLPNVWMGVSVEDDHYTWRANYLRMTPAAVRFLSLEPLLGDLSSLDVGKIDWVIIGGESGPGARPLDLTYAAYLVERCQVAEVPVFVKQLGSAAGKDHHDIDTFPKALQVRQMPGG